jgi:hypothetical protein
MIVKTCTHIKQTWTEDTPVFCCDNCYQPKHARTATYYRVRTAVRFLFWTTVVTVSSTVGIAAIWILWAVA